MAATTVTQLAKAIGAQACGFESADVAFERVVVDSRLVTGGDVFWALRGDRHDGHDFVDEAFARGARFCVVEQDQTASPGRPLVRVDDTRSGLAQFAGWHRRRLSLPVVAVTGSVGKTTAREMIAATLASRLVGTQSPHNYNNDIGVPISLLQIDERHQFAVLELGASRAGEIRDLAEMAAPEIGVLTGIGPAHLTGFGDVTRIAEAKAELIEALPPDGLAVLAGDDPLVRPLARRARCRAVLVGEGLENDLRPERVDVRAEELQVQVNGVNHTIPATGRHHVTAVLAAMAVAREFGLSHAEMAAGLRNFKPVAGRCRLERIGDCTVIDDTYNANPRSMSAACELLREIAADGRKIFVTADMYELGSRAVEFHRQLGKRAAECGIDVLLAYGRHGQDVVDGARAARLWPGAEAFIEFESLIGTLRNTVAAGDVVLVKGSRAMQMERVVDRIRGWADELSQENTSRPERRACG